MTQSGEEEAIRGLAEPFGGDRPAGEDIRLDAASHSLYYRLRDARAEARAAERAADNDPALGDAVPSQWADVRALAIEALATRGKDAEVACWLTEGLTRRDGLSGLAEGADLLADLVERFWSEGLHPPAENDDPEAQLAAITGLSGQDRDGSLLQSLRKTVLFERPDGTPVTLWDYERSADLAASGGGSEAKSAAGIIPFADLESEARALGMPMLHVLDRDVGRAIAGWRRLEDTLEGTVEAGARPSTGRVRGVLEKLRQTAARYAPSPSGTPVDEVGAGESEDVSGSRAEPSSVRGERAEAGGRDAMLDDVLRIAATFRRTEPNAPIGFALEEAVRRARLPWPELMRELIADQAAHATLMTTAGLRSAGAAAVPEA